MKTGIITTDFKRLFITASLIMLVILFLGNVLAVTASIGNARMILRANVGDTIQKTILVKNINNESINIELFASGDLEKDIKILDNNFTLAPGSEKDARFTIKIAKEGAFENKINVKFFSPTEQKGVVLSSNVVVMVNQVNEAEEVNSSAVDNNPENNGEVSGSKLKFSPTLLLSITGVILLVFFIILIVYYVRSSKKAESNNSEIESNENEELNEEKPTKSKKRMKKK